MIVNKSMPCLAGPRLDSPHQAKPRHATPRVFQDPRLALPRPAWPCPTLPGVALPRLTLPCMFQKPLPSRAMPRHATPSLARPCLTCEKRGRESPDLAALPHAKPIARRDIVRTSRRTRDGNRQCRSVCQRFQTPLSPDPAESARRRSAIPSRTTTPGTPAESA